MTELQPSPVSVLDSSFYKEDSSPSPVMKRNIDFKGFSLPCRGEIGGEGRESFRSRFLFQIDPISLLTANAINISYPDVENHILPTRLFIKILILCSCVDRIRKSMSTQYKTRPRDTLSSISDSVYAGLVSADQIKEANSIADPSVLDVGQKLVVPLPCTCFNGTDNGLPAIYLSYVVKAVDSVAGIAANY